MACYCLVGSLVFLSTLAAIVLPAAATAGESSVAPDVHAQHDGVTIDAYSRNGQITFCLNAAKNVKIASEYGVEFNVPHHQTKLWNERLPKLIAGKKPYFDLPKRIDLKTRGAPHERQVSMGLGVCVSALYCTPVAFEITIPAADRVAAANPACEH